MVVIDDLAATLENPAVRDFHLFSGFNLGMYAPVTWFGYAMANFFGKESSAAFHLLSAIVHAVNVMLVFKLFRRLGSNLAVAGMITFAFAIHPIQVESVAWIAGFSTPLFSMFSLLAMNFYLRHCADETLGKNYWMTLAMFLLACLSKSLAVSLPLTLLVLDFWMKRDQNRRTYLEKAPFFAFALAFGALTIYSRQYAPELNQPADFNLLDRGLMVCHTVLLYWTKLILPTGLSIWYPFEKTDGVWNWSYYGSPLLLGALLYGAWRSRVKMPILWIGVLFYLANIILSLPWATFGASELRADRFNYLACLGIFAILAALPAFVADKKPDWVNSTWGLLFGLGVLWLVLAGARIMDWKNSISLVESALASTGDNFGKAYLLRGIVLADRGDGDPAIQDFNKAMGKNPRLYDAYKYRGNIMGLRKNYQQSVVDLTKYINRFPDAAPEIYNRGLSFTNLGRDTAALADYNRCLEIDSTFVRAYRARGNTYLKFGETEKGNTDLKKYNLLEKQQQNTGK